MFLDVIGIVGSILIILLALFGLALLVIYNIMCVNPGIFDKKKKERKPRKPRMANKEAVKDKVVRNVKVKEVAKKPGRKPGKKAIKKEVA